MLLAEKLLGSSSTEANYIEDVFSTWLYTGNSSTQTITNGIDLAGKGGLVWLKSRSGATNHALYDTARGATFDLASNLTTGQTTQANGLTGFLANGFSIGSLAKINTNAATYTSWTFREQPKFFDVVTYTGNGANRTIAHNLGSVPGCIIVKRTDTTGDWQVYHRSLANTQYLVLNSMAAAATGADRWNSTTPTSTVFSLGTDATVNANGGTYVAYLFAHDAGGFGATGADNVISCGSFTGNTTVNLGWEPQWILYKDTQSGPSWQINDNMRGWSQSNIAGLLPNVSNAEINNPNSGLFVPTATGFQATGAFFNSPHIYIAIRRGPMRTPTSGTSVFSPIASSAATGTALTTGFPVDMQISTARSTTTSRQTADRLRGVVTSSSGSTPLIFTNTTSAEASFPNSTLFWDNTGFQVPADWGGFSTIFWNFRRAPSFFDVVCYTGTGVARTVNHNLGVVPELMIFKNRGSSTNWAVYSAAQGATRALYLNDSGTGLTSSAFFNDTAPTSSVFTVNFSGMTNDTAANYVAYLFASCPGVSKVGTYTGTGGVLDVDCGFSAGARFVLIKRTDAAGDWYVWDSARGIVAANDPYLRLNSTAAEVTNTDWVDTLASGFQLSNAAGNLVNVNGASYIFLSVA